MSLQKYELGQKVWCFKQQHNELVKSFGVVQSAEIDKSGFLFYSIMVLTKTNEGITPVKVMANHASIALTETEIEEKMAVYRQFQDEQKALFAERIGAPEFEENYVESKLKE